MAEFSVEATTYRTKHKLNARQQFHIARRIAPVVSVIGAVVPLLQQALSQQTLAPEQDADPDAVARELAERATTLESLGRPIMEALAQLPDADCDYVLDLCMSVVQRMQSGNGSGPLWSDIWNARNARLMFEDIELPAMLMIAMEVLRENLMGFFSARAMTPSVSDTAMTAYPASSG